VNFRLDCTDPEEGPVASFCKHGDESSRSIKKAGYSLKSCVIINF